MPIHCFDPKTKGRKDLLEKIWNNEDFTDVLLSLSPKPLPDSALYLLQHFERFLTPDFMPTNEDILRMRQPTTGVQEITIPVGDRKFRLIDLGGQRNERRKWIHCFDDVAAVIFIASLADYNMSLIEDNETNRLEESIALFKTFLETEFFKGKPIILFLNKADIFSEKIKHHHLKDGFKDYRGMRGDNEDARDFILKQFVENRR